MKYFKNTELAKLYNVSEKSVRNWIQAAIDGKLDLILFREKSKPYIANTTTNLATIEQLVLKGKKYKNRRAFKSVAPSQKFYELYTPQQLLDIVSNLDIHREIPYQYTYFNGGATYWDEYAQKLLHEKVTNSVNGTIKLLDSSRKYIDDIVADYKSVNIIDVGVGNCLPVKDLLQHTLNKGVLKRYIGIDLSNELLNIAEQNIHSWFGKQIKFEKYVRDINYERFYDLLVEESFLGESNSSLNIVLFLGGTISNLREPDQTLRNINASMGRNDLFIMTRKLDTERARRHFDFSVEENDMSLAPQDKFILDLLNVDHSFYTIEQFFDENTRSRVIQAKLKIDLSINFEFENYRKTIELNKGENILIWRSQHQNMAEVLEQFEKNSFTTLQAAKTKDQEYSIFISKLTTS
ncbi:MAG: L-histidine N(alpha)-methyltransferase [Candidatus Saccharimonadales bacterium]